MVADGNAEFSKKLGLDADSSAFGMGQRSRRFAKVLQDGVVKHLGVEQPKEFKVSSAEAILAVL
jgi:peroxiredoxin